MYQVLVLKSQKVPVIVMVPVLVSDKIYSKPGLEPELEPEPQFGFAAPRSRNRNKYFRLRNTGYHRHCAELRHKTMLSVESSTQTVWYIFDFSGECAG